MQSLEVPGALPFISADGISNSKRHGNAEQDKGKIGEAKQHPITGHQLYDLRLNIIQLVPKVGKQLTIAPQNNFEGLRIELSLPVFLKKFFNFDKVSI